MRGTPKLSQSERPEVLKGISQSIEENGAKYGLSTEYIAAFKEALLPRLEDRLNRPPAA